VNAKPAWPATAAAYNVGYALIAGAHVAVVGGLIWWSLSVAGLV
jgi:hypothetical protein